VPADLADELHEPLREHFRTDPGVQVIVEQRGRSRRARSDRRATASEQPETKERRQLRATSGRRIADRRANLVAAESPGLPGGFAPHADRLRFVERVEPSTLAREDADTARLVSRLQAGETGLFAELYMRYFDRIYAYLRISLQDTHEAEDATQEVFIRVLEALPGYERRSVPFRAWLFRIVRNSAINRIRQRGRLSFESPEEMQRRAEASPLGASHGDSLDWLEDRDLVGMIEQLPLAQRQVIVLRYMLELRGAEIADILDRSPDAVRQLHQRAMRYLRARMSPTDKAPLPAGRGRVERASMRRAVRPATVLRARRYMLS
jgi:RNA polymerase sigma-70 factor (ECF subfamily)